MRHRSARGGWFDEADEAGIMRYHRYFNARYGIRTKWYWTFWDSPKSGYWEYHFGSTVQPWDVRNYGTPFSTSSDGIVSRYDMYYVRRMVWRRWSIASAKCMAARNGKLARDER